MLYSLIFTTAIILASTKAREEIEHHANRDDLYKFLNDFGSGTGRPTGDDIDNSTLDAIAYNLPQSAVDTLNAHCEKLIHHRNHLDAKEDNDAKIAKEHKRRMLKENSLNRRRMAVDTTCVNDLTVLCDPATPAYTTGSSYETLANVLRIPAINLLPTTVPTSEAIQSYTDANVYAVGLTIVHAANLLLDTFDEFCDAAANCAGSIPIIGDLIDCIGGLACATVAVIGNALISAAEYGLDYADFHDGVLLTTHMQTLFEDREHIIANQKSIVYEIGETEDQIGIWFDDLHDFVESEINGLEDLINTRFAELTQLNIDLFNLQNEWLNTQLNSIGVLLRTPSGQRPGWNGQNTTKILDDPNNLPIPEYV
jgi:hypothetical protein